ncbi:MAG: class I SAM-dependent methyltransferase [Methylococcaceae bacterium]|jgi:SAM-dependent methyltransferase
MKLRTTPVSGPHDIQAFFDQLAPHYVDCHGEADSLLQYRLGMIEALLADCGRSVLLEIGCGTGLHLFALAEAFEHSIGTDLSPGMIAAADTLRQQHPRAGHISLRVDAAETLATVAPDSADVVLCVGAFEHMPDKRAVLGQVWRVLKPGGSFICLTPNGDHPWYRLAPWLGLATRHLSSDHFLGRTLLGRLLAVAGFQLHTLNGWTFVPRGDMPWLWAGLMTLADGLGRRWGLVTLRGGLCCRAIKPR